MIRARFVLDQEKFPEIALLGIAATPRPGDLVQLNRDVGAVSHTVKWINFFPQSAEADVAIGCEEISNSKSHPPSAAIPLDDLKERMKSVVDLQYRIHEKSLAYSNVILLAGYAGIFALWGFVKDKLSNFDTGLVAVLTGISLVLYVSFELYGMIIRSIFAAGAMNVVSTDPKTYFEELERFDLKIRRLAATMATIWKFVLPPTVATGFFAALYLMYAIFKTLVFQMEVTPPPP